jgi:hypothetical protein
MTRDSKAQHELPDERHKMRQLVLYVSKRMEGDPGFGQTILNKVLVHADFAAYARLGESITHYEYQALEDGPALVAMVPMLEEMQDEGLIRIEYRGDPPYVQGRVVALQDPDLSQFDGSELAIVERAINRMSDMTAREASRESHKFPGWQHAWARVEADNKDRATIPYESVFWSPRRHVSPEQHQYARVLAEEFDLI